LPKAAESQSRRWLANEGFLIPLFISGARNELNMAKRRFQAVDIKPQERRKIADSNASWREYSRSGKY
jgi:hypothetical protein